MTSEIVFSRVHSFRLAFPMGREVFRITPDRRVIVAPDIYQAARDFWDLVIASAPATWSVEVGDSDA